MYKQREMGKYKSHSGDSKFYPALILPSHLNGKKDMQLWAEDLRIDEP